MIKGKVVFAAGGLIGAVLASTCCIVPFALLLLGISGAWISYVTALAPYQPFFLVESLVFLGIGFWKIYGKPETSCEEGAACSTHQSEQMLKGTLWIATLLILSTLGVELFGLLLL
ncbi:MAG: mercuric transporter [Nitrospirales bacterium]|nr:MAG: mercuric transporter [Nitrospirales bacterium]